MTDQTYADGIPSEPVDELSRVGREILRAIVMDNVDLPTAMSAAFPGAPPAQLESCRGAVLGAMRDLIDWKLITVRTFVDGEELLGGSGAEVVERLSSGWERYSEPALVELECTPRGRAALKEYGLRQASGWLVALQALGRTDDLQLLESEDNLLSTVVGLLESIYRRDVEGWKA